MNVAHAFQWFKIFNSINENELVGANPRDGTGSVLLPIISKLN